IITQPEQVSVALTFEQASPAMQRKFFSHLQQLKTIFTAHCGTHWVWHEQLTLSPNRQVAAVQTTLPGHNVLLQQQWPPIIAFCKKNLIALDAFWADTKEGFEWLQDNS
ncbi:MAG TPA: DUF4268 domain-containing protein, partial [Phnomibacter sp.]|nr:DUF4268 domain-containing protein [Phnomibacter sp.]